MGAAAAIAAAGVAASVGSTIAGSGGGGGGGATGSYGGNPATYIPTGQPQSDANFQNLTNLQYDQAQTVPGQLYPLYQQATGAIMNNPYAGFQQAGADAVGSLGGGVAGREFGAAESLYNLGAGAAPYASQILQTGFDPQGDLYNRTQQQVRDQLAATNAMSGLSGTPYGAGVQNQGLTNFNIDWQNQQLQRQATAATSYSNLNSAIGRDYAGASDLYGRGLSTLQSTSSLPYNTYLGQQQNNIGALNTLTGASTGVYGLPQQLLNDYSNYLKLGQNASNLAQSGQNQGFNQGQVVGNNIGQALGGLAGNTSFTDGLDNLFSAAPVNTPPYQYPYSSTPDAVAYAQG